MSRANFIMIRVSYIIRGALFALEILRIQVFYSGICAGQSEFLHTKLIHPCVCGPCFVNWCAVMLEQEGVILRHPQRWKYEIVQNVLALLENPDDCCRRTQKMNETCVNSTHCGCVQVLENSTVRCVQCDSLTMENSTLCNTTVGHNSIIKIGGPGVAASVLLGTLLISLLLILSVASFFYLKRSNRLPGVFYRRKAFIFQPSETAVMMPAVSSSVRKPRYVRRERPSAAAAAGSGASMPVGHVTKVYNVTVQ